MRKTNFLKSLVNTYRFASEKFVAFDFKDPLNVESLYTSEEKLVR